MSATKLTEILDIAAKRYPEDGFGDQEEERDTLLALLEEIVTVADKGLRDLKRRETNLKQHFRTTGGF